MTHRALKSDWGNADQPPWDVDHISLAPLHSCVGSCLLGILIVITSMWSAGASDGGQKRRCWGTQSPRAQRSLQDLDSLADISRMKVRADGHLPPISAGHNKHWWSTVATTNATSKKLDITRHAPLTCWVTLFSELAGAHGDLSKPSVLGVEWKCTPLSLAPSGLSTRRHLLETQTSSTYCGRPALARVLSALICLTFPFIWQSPPPKAAHPIRMCAFIR